MKKTISTILTLTVLAVTLSGSTCFANDPKTTTANSQSVSNQSRKKEFQFGKLLNKNKWGKIALGATAGITALAGATIAGLEVLRAKSYSTSNDTCKFSIDGIAQELKHGTCDNMFKYAVSHLKSFNNVAKSCSVNVNGTSKLPEDNDINNLINFANHYHLNLDEAAKAFTVKDKTNNSVSLVPYDIMCKSVEFSKRFKSSLANAASAINEFGYLEAQELAEYAENKNLTFDDIKALYDSFRINNHSTNNFISNLNDYSKDARNHKLTLKDSLNILKVKDENGNIVFHDPIILPEILNIADTYKLSIDSLKDCVEVFTYIEKFESHDNKPEASLNVDNLEKYIAIATENKLSPNNLKTFAYAYNRLSTETFDDVLNCAKQYNFDLFKILESFSKFSQENYGYNVASIDPNVRYAKLLLEYVTKHKVKLHDIINCCADKAKGNNALEKDFIYDLGKIADYLNDHPEDGRNICKIYKKYANQSKKCANLEVCLYDILDPAAAEAERSYGIKW